MKAYVTEDSFTDAGYPGAVYQIPCKVEVEVTKCDLCEEVIPDGRVLSADGCEDLCCACHETGKIEAYYTDITSGQQLTLFLDRIKGQYEALKKLKLVGGSFDDSFDQSFQ